MFSNNKIFALCFAVLALSNSAHAEKQVAETFGLLGVPGVDVDRHGWASASATASASANANSNPNAGAKVGTGGTSATSQKAYRKLRSEE
ncbi:hypothetical protein AM588_10002832 [Phytophthora nicotianae]|uniref:Uncharacterized protein n=1 Tax=Phytophthora nicotianae TaxID=4792 RepID=A0A0W8D4L8_PHYNI|nr:hypothetical protein AM588_10002832 [Phytophthora nicotianae]